jgi:O-methyltransferase
MMRKSDGSSLAARLARPVNSMLGPLGVRLVRSHKGVATTSHERSPDLLHSRLQPSASYSPWLSDHEFLNLYERIRNFTLVDIYRCYELWQLGQHCGHIEGAILEVGVWRGGTGCLLAKAAPRQTVYLADTFEGVVKAGEQDTRYVGGEHSDTSEQLVLDLLADAGVTNARLLRGIFPDETADTIRGPIALLHVDVDVYQSAKDTVDWALPRLPVGATIIFDDYGFFGCEGVTRLANQLRNDLKGFTFFYNLNGHAIFVRTA